MTKQNLISFLYLLALSIPNVFSFTSKWRDISSYPITMKQQTQNRRFELKMSDANKNEIDFSQVKIMVNGMPGPMATAAAEACLRKGLKLSPVALTGPNVEPMTITVYDTDSDTSSNVRLIPANEDGMIEMKSALEGLRAAMKDDKDVLVIDYTHPSAVNDNGKWYAENSLPFVMGTTGGDRELLIKDVNDGKCPAVIAPNMGKQIVAMQAALEELSKKYPNAFDGYELKVTESHQKTKADTSGTAKAVINSLNVLSGGSFDIENDINMLRSDEESLAFGVKEDALKGHAFHTYTLTSSDGSVQFKLEHNVSGRRVYAEGTADAVKFLARKIRTDEPKIYTMINVLEEGALE